MSDRNCSSSELLELSLHKWSAKKCNMCGFRQEFSQCSQNAQCTEPIYMGVQLTQVLRTMYDCYLRKPMFWHSVCLYICTSHLPYMYRCEGS